MCGMFTNVRIDNSIELPYFPEELDRGEMVWQSKQGLDVYGGPYRVTGDGRVEEKRSSYRQKTAAEKQSEAEKWGCDSWEEYVRVYEEDDSNVAFPDVLDWDKDEDGYDDTPPSFSPSEKIIDEQWWADISFHGTFEVHEYVRRDPVEWKNIGEVERPEEYALEVFIEYELHFNKGDLQDIVFMGSRGFAGDDPIKHALEQIEQWREWKEQ